MDLYSILEVSSDSSDEDIKISYKRLVKKYHPDHGGDDEKCKNINMAYSILSDPEKRQNYDRLNGNQKITVLSMLKDFLQLFICGEDFNEYSKIIDLLLSKTFNKSTVTKSQKKLIDKRKIILDIDEAYGKRFFRLSSHSIVVPVCKGEFILSDSQKDHCIDIDIISSPDITIKDNDIIINHYLNIYEYIYGTDVQIKLPNGDILDRKVDSLVHRETVDIIENLGLYYIDDFSSEIKISDVSFKRGDMYINYKLKGVDTECTKTFFRFKNDIKKISEKDYD